MIKKLVFSFMLVGVLGFSQDTKTGINTTNPQTTLDVNGQVTVRDVQQQALKVLDANCPCFLVVDADGKIARIPASSITTLPGTGTGTTPGTGTGTGTNPGTGVPASEGGLTNADVLSEITWEYPFMYEIESNKTKIDIPVNLPDGTKYSAFMSEPVNLLGYQGKNRALRITYPAGTVTNGKLTASILVNEDYKFTPAYRFVGEGAQTHEITMSFNGLAQTKKFKLVMPENAVKDRKYTQGGTYDYIYSFEKTGTGKIWLAQNLGAKVAKESHAAYTPSLKPDFGVNSFTETAGFKFQYGRQADGHEKADYVNSAWVLSTVTPTKATTTVPNHPQFIGLSDAWTSASLLANLYGVNGSNNPCPQGFHVPTNADFNDAKLSGAPSTYYYDDIGKVSLLRLANSSRYYREYTGGNSLITETSVYSRLWTSEGAFAGVYIDSNNSYNVSNAIIPTTNNAGHSYGVAIRCVKD